MCNQDCYAPQIIELQNMLKTSAATVLEQARTIRALKVELATLTNTCDCGNYREGHCSWLSQR